MKTLTVAQLSQYFRVKVPSDGWTSQGFGVNSFKPPILPNGQMNVGGISLYEYYGWKGHNGIDFTGDKKKVFAPLNGIVHKISKIRKTGNPGDPWWISVWSDQEAEIDGQRVIIQCTYIHCDEFYVNEGDHVTEGQVIARTDNTGYPSSSSGPHLHFGLYPLYWNGLTWVTDAMNGFDGAVDPVPFFSDWVFDIDKYEEGWLIQPIGSPRVYLIEGRKRRWYPSQFAFWKHQGKAFSECTILQMAPFEVVKIPLGEPMPEGTVKMKEEINKVCPNLLK